LSVSRFIEYFRAAFEGGQLLKSTLSRPSAGAPAELKNVYVRPVELKAGLRLAFTYRYTTRDEVKNYPLDEAVNHLQALLGGAFLNADLFTAAGDHTLSFSRNGEPHLATRKASQSVPAASDLRHDRAKTRLLDPASPWLHTLGITSAKGEVLAAAHDKWRQINKFLEVIDSLVRAHALPEEARICDMGSGKGYLTFALYEFLTRHHGLKPQITGIELRPKLVELCNKAAQQAGFTGLDFVATDINDFQPGRLDMLIALHACDTATDLALAKGVHEHAAIIVAAPCCHKQVRKEMEAHNELAPVLRHGILEERQAEIVTDGIRALLLEAEGYRTQVFEFISTEHTAKNVMITAVAGAKGGAEKREQALRQVAALKTGFGVREHYLEHLLKH
jgi:SAM-dependent methyltransferase